jgi:hypothetical protein
VVAPNGSGPTADLPRRNERLKELMAFGIIARRRDCSRGFALPGFALRSPGQISLGARTAGALPRLPWPPFDLSVSLCIGSVEPTATGRRALIEIVVNHAILGAALRSHFVGRRNDGHVAWRGGPGRGEACAT